MGLRDAANRRWSKRVCCRGWRSRCRRCTSKRPPRRRRLACSKACGAGAGPAEQSRSGRIAGGVAAGAILGIGPESAAGSGPVRAMASCQAERREPGTGASFAALRRRAVTGHRHGTGRFLARRQPVYEGNGNRDSGRARIQPWSISLIRFMPARCWPPLAGPTAACRTISASAKEQNAFLDQAVAGLAQEGKVISVRLALFAEMVKGKPWTPATLKQSAGRRRRCDVSRRNLHRLDRPAATSAASEGGAGGVEGVVARSGDRHQGPHAVATRVAGSIGLRRPSEGLRRICCAFSTAKSASSRRPTRKARTPPIPRRLSRAEILPADPRLSGAVAAGMADPQAERDEPRPGGILLADRSVVWNARPENRQLPSLWQWGHIRWLTAKKKWTPPQRKMMGKAGRYHAVRGLVLVLLLAAATFAGLTVRNQVIEKQKATQADGLVQGLLKADRPRRPRSSRK